MGIAISDEGGRMAFPKETLEAKYLSQIKKILRENNIGEIILGLPKMPDQRETEETRAVCAFAAMLGKQTTVPIVFEDELLTTRIVKGEGMGKNHKDESAAALILQSYLDKLNK